MSHFENFIDSQYPFASDETKRKARSLYVELRFIDDLRRPTVPDLCSRYNDALRAVALSHKLKTNELFEVAFANDRRSNYVSNESN